MAIILRGNTLIRGRGSVSNPRAQINEEIDPDPLPVMPTVQIMPQAIPDTKNTKYLGGLTERLEKLKLQNKKKSAPSRSQLHF